MNVFYLTLEDKNIIKAIILKEFEDGSSFIYCSDVSCERCPVNKIIISEYKNLKERLVGSKDTACSFIYKLIVKQIKLENKIKEVIKDGKQF